WIEWKNGNLKDKNKSYILKGCYFYLKNFIRKNGNNKILSLEEMEEKYVFPKKMEDIKKYDELTLYEEIYEVLNEREKKVLNLLIEGYTTREIGKILGVSHVMVIKIIKKIKNKLIETKIEI
ncbi:MAG: LuxR C-terminal-related transcriptional regulator, partial [bacterium]|nr:LuxR C-terminal-related transcriptional regulator [bacterium]MDW8163401.1 LuxR C-terminal-related transcriptional regulator [Candidatus Omnitrophota bacterium]